jgi:hypothetical protein
MTRKAMSGMTQMGGVTVDTSCRGDMWQQPWFVMRLQQGSAPIAPADNGVRHEVHSHDSVAAP